MTARDLLDLVRIPALPTALSDTAAAAALCAAAGTLRPGGAVAALGVGAALYLAGMVLNDLADRERDRRERPTRPLPSGRVGETGAAALGLLLLALGLGLAVLALDGWATGLAFALAGAIAVYDFALAGRPLVGPVGMALCRGLHWAMALAACGGAGGAGALATGVVVLYVLGLTQLSLDEAGAGERRGRVVLPAALATAAAAVGVALLWATGERLALPAGLALAALALLLGRNAIALARAGRSPIPPNIGPAVGTMVGNILWLDAALALARAPWPWILPFLLLGVAQEWLRRHFRVS